MGNLIGWIALACLVLVCATATTVASRLAYGRSPAIASLSSAEFAARFRRARSAGWLLSIAWILSSILALLVFWPPNGLLVGYLAGSVVLLVAILMGLDNPRTIEFDEKHLDG